MIIIKEEKEIENKQEMTKNDIKKLLYKNKPEATLRLEDSDGAVYAAEIDQQKFVFYIPKNELYNEDGKKIFTDHMESQLLIRWLVYPK